MTAGSAVTVPSAAPPARPPVVGIVGAGQLARMTYQAAIALGLRPRLLAPAGDESAALVGADVSIGSATDAAALERFASGCDVLTLDHELVDVEALDELARAGRAVRPGPRALELARDKRLQREIFGRAGLPLPAHALVRTPAEAASFAADNGGGVVLKSPRGGYDGRGVWLAADEEAVRAAFAAVGGRPLLAEELLDLEAELSVLVARRPSGETVVYPPVRTVQRDGICRELHVPALVEPELAAAARRVALEVASLTEATGILAVELFVANGRVLVNEIAARPHNSGHFSIEGSVTSQFQNHLRGILDWPLGDVAPTAPAVATVNVLGTPGCDPVAALPRALAVAGANVHLYAKEPRPGRKIGHVTVLGATLDDALDRARAAAGLLVGQEA